MALFELPTRAGREQDTKLAKKSKTATKKNATIAVSSSSGISARISAIKAMVAKNLGKYEETTQLILDESKLHDYISKAIENGIIAIDTETTGLDPMLDECVGVCIYTPGQLTAYIPINHKSYITMQRNTNQLLPNIVADELRRLENTDVKVIMFNAPFDIRVLRNQLHVYLKCYWDCYVGARLLNENEGFGNNKLKLLHAKYVLNGKEDAFTFDDLFNGVTFDLVPIRTGYLYAAHDAIVTYELYEFQRQYLDVNQAECKRLQLEDVAYVFHEIEMPIVDVVCNMEDNGITFDKAYAHELSVKYNKQKEEVVKQFEEACDVYRRQIDAYRIKTGINCKLDTPINIASSTQIGILIYDILLVTPPDPKNPRGTGVDILSKIDNDIARTVLKYREIDKLLSTYIDKLPECVNPNDGRVHCKFNQYGADTGRFSSSSPNLQNIPSHNKDIRKMFTAADGYVLMSSDFSQQENCDYIKVDYWCEVETPKGWVYADRIQIGDKLLVSDTDVNTVEKEEILVTKIEAVDKNHIIFYYTTEVM